MTVDDSNASRAHRHDARVRSLRAALIRAAAVSGATLGLVLGVAGAAKAQPTTGTSPTSFTLAGGCLLGRLPQPWGHVSQGCVGGNVARAIGSLGADHIAHCLGAGSAGAVGGAKAGAKAGEGEGEAGAAVGGAAGAVAGGVAACAGAW